MLAALVLLLTPPIEYGTPVAYPHEDGTVTLSIIVSNRSKTDGLNVPNLEALLIASSGETLGVATNHFLVGPREVRDVRVEFDLGGAPLPPGTQVELRGIESDPRLLAVSDRVPDDPAEPRKRVRVESSPQRADLEPLAPLVEVLFKALVK